MRTVPRLIQLKSISMSLGLNLEFILIDGLSCDGSYEYASAQNIFDIHLTQRDTGIYSAMNKGIHLATGYKVIFNNSGDILRLDFLDFLLQSLQLPPNHICHGSVCITNASFRSLIHPRILSFSLLTMPSFHPSTLYPTVLLKSFLFDESYRIAADFKQLTSIKLARVPFSYLPFVVSEFDGSGCSSNFFRALGESRQALVELGYNRVVVWPNFIISSAIAFLSRFINSFIAK